MKRVHGRPYPGNYTDAGFRRRPCRSHRRPRSAVRHRPTPLNGKQREFPAPPWAGVKRVRSATSLFLCIGTPYYGLEPTLSASQNPRTHIGVRRGVVRKTPSFVITKISDFRTTPGLCRALVKGRTPTDTPATAATDDLCCGGTHGVFGCYRFHASPRRDERGRN